MSRNELGVVLLGRQHEVDFCTLLADFDREMNFLIMCIVLLGKASAVVFTTKIGIWVISPNAFVLR